MSGLVLPKHIEEARKKEKHQPQALQLPLELKEIILPNGVKLRQREVVKLKHGEPGIWYTAPKTGMRVMATTYNTPDFGRLLVVSLSFKSKLPSLVDVYNVRAAFYPNDVSVVIKLDEQFVEDMLHNVMEIWQAPYKVDKT